MVSSVTMAATDSDLQTDRLSLNSEESSLKSPEDDDREEYEDWGFPLRGVYKLAVRFFKEKEGKAVHLSYMNKVHLVAYTQQVSHGKFSPEVSPPVGYFDVIGYDRRQVWQSLGEMSKEEAMKKFIELINETCPLFRPYVEAHRRDREEQQRKAREDEEKRQQEEEIRKREEETKRKEEEDRQRQEIQKRKIQEALNQQTYHQFKAYAEAQYPNNPEQQAVLIRQLQEQHYKQYMQQVYQQQSPGDGGSGSKGKKKMENGISSPSSVLASTPVANNNNVDGGEDGVTDEEDEGESEGEGKAGIEGIFSMSLMHLPHHPCHEVAFVICSDLLMFSLIKALFYDFKQESVQVTPQTKRYHVKVDVNPSKKISLAEHNFHTYVSSEKSLPECDEGDSKDCEAVVEDSFAELVIDDLEFHSVVSSPFQELPPIQAASMWTRKDINEFKELIRKESSESIIKVRHGETVTVRVPTHEDGACLFWEFATDSYDIGFGLYFEWTKSPTSQVSVHISESEEEDDEEDEEAEEVREGDLPGDVEKGSGGSKREDRPPTTVVIPTYRRDCHEEVYAGNHVYPGEGVYLLKFDNSYSVWRSKTLYYRVYYTR